MKDALSLEAEAEQELFEAQQMRRTMQAEVWTGAGLLGCVVSVASGMHSGGDWAGKATAAAEGLLLWAVVLIATRRAARTK